MKKIHTLSFIFVIGIAGCAHHKQHLPPVVDNSLPSPAYRNQYYVHKGDTLYSIAFANDADYRDLAVINGLKIPYALHPGQRLRVRKSPSMNGKTSLKSMGNKGVLNQGSRHHVQVSKAQPMRFSAVSEIEKNRQKTHKKISKKAAEQKIQPEIQKNHLNPQENYVQCWSWPIRGKVINPFSPGQLGNKGIDIAGQLGQPVKAASSGIVVYSGSGLTGYGNLIIIKHNSRYLSAYAYNYELRVKEGDRVKAGQEIATVGRANSGQLMLHFEIRCDGLPVNPTQYLR